MPDISLNTDRTHSTTKGREEATLKRVGSTEMWFRGETDRGWCRKEGTIVLEKGERERGTHNGNVSPKLLAWKRTGADFCEFLQPVGPGVLSSAALAEIEPERHCTAPGEKAGKPFRGRQCWNSDLKSSWGT